MKAEKKFTQYLILHGRYCNRTKQSWYQTERGAKNAIAKFVKAGERVVVNGVYIAVEPIEHIAQVELDPKTLCEK